MAAQSPLSTSVKIIGFDLDGVIVDNTELKLRLAAEQGWKLEPRQTPAGIIATILPEDVLNEVRRIYNDADIALSAPLMAGARAGLERVRSSGTRYFLISRRRIPEHAIGLLRRQGLWPSIFNESNAFFVVTPEDKDSRARELGVTHYVDDEPSVLEKLVSVRSRALFDPHGAFGHVNDYPRIGSWDDLMRHFFDE